MSISFVSGALINMMTSYFKNGNTIWAEIGPAEDGGRCVTIFMDNGKSGPEHDCLIIHLTKEEAQQFGLEITVIASVLP